MGAQKNELKPHLKTCWVIPPKENAAFVACMENLLDLYHRPFVIAGSGCMGNLLCPGLFLKFRSNPLSPSPGMG